jgi:hypothetical protein
VADNSVGCIIDTLLRNDLIIIDEVGFAPLDDTGAQLLFRVVAAAYERRSLGIASHWPFESWGRFLSEHTTAVSPLDRLLHHASVVVTESAPTKPGFPVEQFACDLQVTGVRSRLLDHVEDDPADVRDLLGVLRVMVKVEPARGRGQRGDGEDLVGSPALVAVVGDEVGAGPTAGEGGFGIVGAFFLVFRLLGRRRFLHDARGHVLEPMVFDAAQVPEHPRHRPARGHDGRLPGILRQPFDDLQH